MSVKKFANEPMLYIQQPNITRPEAPMQHQYTTPNKRRETVNSESNTSDRKKSTASPRKKMKHNSFQQELMGKATEELEELELIHRDSGQEEKDEVTPNRKKQFKEMTLKEKVLYLADSPTYAPKVKCEIKTEDKSYRGLVTNFEEDTVFLQVGRKTASTSIPFKSIIEIRLIGF
ncbi:CotO family spore coat protein [Oceanobacillus chungangensis]|uniref:Spore coat protein CotO n=1 Tax=Oceanobacillus chungangensis TaxID=1229152 RepID=A0A3D8PIU5_9BACI|nr:CotO family spore coat protein [Oceanobacillus chungangensis]RDW15974.1 hypothetical protein CWR45_15890 [Oceanobacillus chungangensis]